MSLQHLTPSELLALRAYVETGSQKEAAHVCGVSVQTIKNTLGSIYNKLGTGGILRTLVVLGWVTLPGETMRECGWIGYCSLTLDHEGRHGRWRDYIGGGALE